MEIKNNLKKTLIILLLTTLVFSADKLVLPSTNTEVFQSELYLTQQLDHFSSTSSTFQQRYFVLNQFATNNSKLIVYICGEGPCAGITQQRLFPAELAQQLGATVVTLEHRFYGKSVPSIQGTISLSTAHLQYLTIEQALADIAALITKCTQQGMLGFNNNTKVVTIGGSYPGALSAWFRQKYPHLTVGALASSAVVQPIIQFYQFDRQTALSLQKVSYQCYFNYKLFFLSLQQLDFDQLKQKVQNSLGEQFVLDTIEDTQWMVIDMIAMGVQYGHKHLLCKNMNDIWNLLPKLQNIFNMNDGKDYDQSALQHITYDFQHQTSSRQWMWQSCTQVGWFQTRSTLAMRTTTQNMLFYQHMCNKVFGIDIQTQQIQEVQQRYKGIYNEATNIIFTNGADDQWQWASITTNTTYQHHVIYIDCLHMDCGHCQDLHTSTTQDDQVLLDARNTILQLFSKWLQ